MSSQIKKQNKSNAASTKSVATNKNRSPNILVIILNYNGESLLKKHISSVSKTKYPNFDILVVDNGSKDNSLDYIKKHYPDIKILALDKNYGFGRANNQAFAQFPDYKYYALLNNDVSVKANWLSILVETAQKDPQIAAVGPKILFPHKKDGKHIINSAGMSVDKYCRGIDRYYKQKNKSKYDKIEEVEALTGGAILLNAEAIKDVHGFDNRMFLYYEDVDLSLRLRDKGWQLIYNGNSEVFHEHQATAKHLHNNFSMNFQANFNRIMSFQSRFGIIAAGKESIRTFVEWMWCKITGKSMKQLILDNIKNK